LDFEQYRHLPDFIHKNSPSNDKFPMGKHSLSDTQEKTISVFALQDIRPMTVKNLAAVIELENMAQPRPWSETSFREELNNPFSTVNLLWQGDEVAGYICYHILVKELNILNLVTALPFRRRGVARFLLEAAMSNAFRKKVEKGFLEVREGNLAAISLYASCGFQCLMRRKNYYSDGEDALVMERQFGY
jgi:[ribosomal protein S18]-alanine N-acetyltransferase